MPIIVPYAELSTCFTVYFFFSFLVLLPLFFTADELVYCKSAYDSSFDNNSSFSSGVRICNTDLSELANKTFLGKRFIKYSRINNINLYHV
jgi:hypothetical protein